MFESSFLPAALREHPLAEPPWSDGDGAAALARLRATKTRRLASFGQLLRRWGIELDAGLRGDSPLALCRSLDHWVARAWPPLADRAEVAEPARWLARAWAPSDRLIYTLVLDVGLALGELLRRHRPALAWGVDDFEDHLARADESAGRVVLLDPTLPADAREPQVFDTLSAAYARLQAMARGQEDDTPTLAQALEGQLRAAPRAPTFEQELEREREAGR
jgi:hypothetical protein